MSGRRKIRTKASSIGHSNLIDLTDQRFGKLIVLSRVPQAALGHRVACWLCRCDCGAQSIVRGGLLRQGKTRSCGCLRHEPYRRTHGRSTTHEYYSWSHMRQRCQNPRSPDYPRYGGRGIRVCKRWQVFENFLADMGPMPKSGMTLERKNNNAGYTPRNCRWASRLEQAQNTRQVLSVKHQGETFSLAAVARATGIGYGALKYRIHQLGLTPEAAIAAGIRL